MNPFPGVNSVLVLDNAKIHHDQELLEYLDAIGVKVEFLPPYSPDLNPIESAFATIKKFLQRNRYFVAASLMVSRSPIAVTPQTSNCTSVNLHKCLTLIFCFSNPSKNLI